MRKAITIADVLDTMDRITDSVNEANKCRDVYANSVSGWYAMGPIHIWATIYPDGFYYLGRNAQTTPLESFRELLISFGVAHNIAEEVDALYGNGSDTMRKKIDGDYGKIILFTR